MKISPLSIICLCGGFFPPDCLHAERADSSPSIRVETAVVQPIDCSSISRIDAMFINKTTSFRIAVTAQVIECSYDYKISLNTKGWGKLNELCDHLHTVIVGDGDQNMDFRYALIGYDHDGK